MLLRASVVLVLSLVCSDVLAEPTRRDIPRRPYTVEEAGAGTLLFHGSDSDDSWLAPQVSNEVELHVTGPIARAQVTQVFENLSDEVVHATYVFPLPETA